MPKRNIDFQKGDIFHIYNRGARKSPIFRSSEEYQYLVNLIRIKSAVYHMAILTYCLMPNHYHLLLRQEEERPVSIFMRSVFCRYSNWFNARLDYSGALFEARFKAILVNSEPYLSYLCAYIHLNPVKAGLVKAPWEWDFSNCRNWVDGENLSSEEINCVQDYFGSSSEYRAFLFSFTEQDENYPEDIIKYRLD